MAGSNISNNTNRGVDARGHVMVDVNTSTFTNNGNAAFGTDGNDGFTILAQRGANVTASNNTIIHPSSSTTPVTAFNTGNTPANTITASNNSISMNGNVNAKGARNTGGNTITATCNWWGVTGANVAPLMSGVVSFETFLSSGTDSDGAAGFQPVAGTCNGCSSGGSITNTTSGKSFCTIQAAIDDAATTTGDVIIVGAGIYAENIIVSKSLDIRGPNYNISPNGGSRVAEAIIVPATNAVATGEIIHISASDVTINGFTIDGDNALLTGGANNTNGVDMNAAEGVTVYEDNINNLTVSNNILQNLSYFGITLYGASFSSPASSGHVVSNNKFQNFGTYTDGTNQVNLWGGGVLLYNNQYAAITDNVMTNVRLGIQSGNFSRANSGTAASQIISGNTMQVRRVGVFHNLHYSLTSPYTFSNNTITGLANVNETGVRGFLLGSLSVNSTLTDNNVDLTGVTATTTGIEVWNVKNTTPSAISGGTITGVNTGVFINNYDGYNSNATDGAYATLSGMTITPNAAGTGIRVYDNPSSTHVGVQATIGAGITINNGTTGISVENTSAQMVSPTGNLAFVGQTGDYIKLVNNANNINVVAASFDGKMGNAMTSSERLALEGKLLHKPDVSCTGKLEYFLPVQNVTQNTFFADIQPAIAAAVANDVIELSEWTFAEGITIDKPLTIQGIDSANVILDGASIANANGITLANGIQNITIKKLKIKNFKGSSALGSGIYGAGGNNNLMIDEIVLDNNQGRGGIYLAGGGGINNVTIKNSISKNNSVAGSRGIVIWDGFKQNITITGNKVYNNNCCGIELQDGTASGVTITDNIVFGNVDNGLGLTGLMQGAGANLIKNNTVINNGRFGIEIKLPNGTGATSGDGSIVVEDNTIQQSIAFDILRPSEVRDIAGIAVFRRGYVVSYGNVDIPKGVVVRNNTVSGFAQNNPSSRSTGFGIVIEGTDHTVTDNTLNNNNVGIQQQSGHLPYTTNAATDGDQANLADLYFGRGNSPLICNNVISTNTFSGNTIIDARNIRNGAVVTEDITPTVDAITSQVVCNGSSSTLISFTGNTITGKTYSWTNTTPSIGLAASGSGDISAFTVTNTTTVAVTATITVTPIANGCSGTPATFTITVNPSPVITASSNSPQCVGSALNLMATGGTDYSWSGPNSFTSSSATPSISSTTNADAGTYTVTVTDANGCTATATTAVTIQQLPTASIVSNSPICSGGNVNFTLTTNGTSYVWSGPNLYNSTDQSPSISAATNANSGTYTVVVMSAEGCTTTATISVTVNPLPNAIAGSNSPQCVGGTLSLTSDNGTSYAWSGPNSFSSTDQNPNIPSVTNAANGTYSVTVTDVNGCSATATTAVTINPKPAKPTILPSSTTICEGGNATLVVICPGNTVSWSNGASGSSITVSPIITTSYTATCTNSFGCVSDASDPATVNIVAKPTTPVITPSITTICAGGSATLTATACTNGTLTWSNGTTSTSNTLNVSPSADQSYTVTCTSIFGCVSVASDPVNVIVNPIPTAPTALISSGASALLTATCTAGTPVWYSSSTATTSLGVGSYTTPALTVNTTYYVACETVPGGTSMTNPQNCQSSRTAQVVTIDVFAIITHPESIYVCTGQNATFTVGATGASITYQWQVNTGSGWNDLSDGSLYSGVNTATLNVAQASTTLDNNQYRCIITNTKPDALSPLTLMSNPAILVVKTSALANNLIMVSPLASISNLYQAVQTITATNKISGTSKIDYFAGNSITLNPGFEVSAGSVFKAKIQLPCTNTSSPIPDTLKK